MLEAKEYEAAGGDLPDREAFVREILPDLARLPLSAIAAATGLSLAYCSLIRRGLYVPHPRHWEALNKLTESGWLAPQVLVAEEAAQR